ncbi:hypothetical protein FAVG1_08491 [Fusarium avenaceum]|nr:hypothetical protein FAVG1_08491 [Fusarium avenaceum]
MASNGLNIIMGGAVFAWSSVDVVKKWLDLVEKLGIKSIDTAQLYGHSEELLGKARAASRFTIDTKIPGALAPDLTTEDYIVASCKESLKKLGTDKVDIYYLHAPDRRVPIKEIMGGLDKMYRQGAFKRLGLSNFLGEEVEEIVRIAKENNFVVPTVYQGNYSAVARRADEEIFPILRKHGIAFYAYSPIAGGFLSKSEATLMDPEGRFGKGDKLSGLYNGMYNRPSFVAALSVWGKIAEDEGVSRAELAYRWVAYHSQLRGDLGDAIVIGASKEEHVKETMEALKRGPLTNDAVKRIDGIWDSVKEGASLDNFEMQTKF